ncbi:hypothetical protein H5J25_16360 [Sphingomonas aliaeris]|jgi:hypothetical protein|uniref:Uncharacterized protein n=1 Tax=Sphingomonas aliaeris TaxID=2759526 RepID=A0A974S3U7_9SPHN|nr:DUF6771 family protein [Sphingomonas aliaeris]QQV76933.1 hypothetical protein H5J25_16360 [Sphingomonas aliaeris]
MFFESPSSPATASLIAAAIMSTSHVTRLALSSDDEQVRDRAAADIAQAIITRLELDARQLKLAL